MGYIYVYTGTGAGKTTNALGLALRCVGHGKHAVIIQFLKWWKNIGEYKIRNKLKPYYEIYQFGRPGWIKVKNGETKVVRINNHVFHVRSVNELDKKLCEKGLEFARQIMLRKKPTLLVLDEINLAVKWKLIDVDKVLELLDSVPERTHVVLTGRYAHRKIIERADFVNVIVERKSPKEMVTTEGIQY